MNADEREFLNGHRQAGCDEKIPAIPVDALIPYYAGVES